MKLIAFDFDGTLIEGRLIGALARKFGFESELGPLLEEEKFPRYEQSLKISHLLKGIKIEEVEEVARELPLIPGARETLEELERRDYTIDIVSDSYKQGIDAAMEKLPVDLIHANELIVNHGSLTGNIRMPLGWAKPVGCLKHSVCKLNALLEAAKRTGINVKDTVAVGNGRIDACMLEVAGL
ncbi:MAG: HAD-IB family phosphatase, partial [Candidatus Hadarchaeota archaeon]|nr:HAD-IB family phosphatase [Candidatus Hadarchaeota archaeon]